MAYDISITGSTKIEIPQGDTYNQKFTLTLNGAAWDVSGYNHKLYVKASRDESAPEVLVLDGTTGGASNNEVTFSFTHPQTKLMDVGVYYYDYKMYAANWSLVKTLVRSKMVKITLTLERSAPSSTTSTTTTAP